MEVHTPFFVPNLKTSQSALFSLQPRRNNKKRKSMNQAFFDKTKVFLCTTRVMHNVKIRNIFAKWIFFFEAYIFRFLWILSINIYVVGKKIQCEKLLSQWTSTVKLGDKELFDKEQIGIQEPFPVTNCQFTS